MLEAIRNKRPWVAAAVALFLTPVASMLYLNRGRASLFYLAAFAGLIAAAY